MWRYARVLPNADRVPFPDEKFSKSFLVSCWVSLMLAPRTGVEAAQLSFTFPA